MRALILIVVVDRCIKSVSNSFNTIVISIKLFYNDKEAGTLYRFTCIYRRTIDFIVLSL